MTRETIQPWIFEFLTLVLIPALGYYLSQLIKGKDRLQNELWEKWQEGARERNQAILARMDSLDKCLSGIKGDLKRKVEDHFCEKNRDQVWSAIDKIRDRMQ